jgi:O-antigen ligase
LLSIIWAENSYSWLVKAVALIGSIASFFWISGILHTSTELKRATDYFIVVGISSSLLSLLWNMFVKTEHAFDFGIDFTPGILSIPFILAKIHDSIKMVRFRYKIYFFVVLLSVLLSEWRASVIIVIFMTIGWFVIGSGKVSLKGVLIYGGILASVFFVILNIEFDKVPLLAKFSRYGAVGMDISSGRINLWDNALKIYSEHPIGGVGLGNFSNHYFKGDMITYFNLFGIEFQSTGIVFIANDLKPHPHNLTLVLLSEYGTIGMFLFYSILVISVYCCYKAISINKSISDSLLVGISQATLISILGLFVIGQFSGAGTEYGPHFWFLFSLSAALRQVSWQKFNAMRQYIPHSDKGSNLYAKN